MKLGSYIFYVIISLFLVGCTSIKDVKDNSGSIVLGNDNIVINFPKDDNSYSQSEVQTNVDILQRTINQLNKRIQYESTGKNNDLEEVPQSKKKELNELKEKRDKAFDALQAWENLYNGTSSIYIDGKTRLLTKYKLRSDSLEEEITRLQLQNQQILSDVLNKGVETGKFDSILENVILQSTIKFPPGTTFVEDLDEYSYERMLTLREERITNLEKKSRLSKIKVKNLTSGKIYCAVRYFALDKQWVTTGWQIADPGEQVILSFYTNKNGAWICANHADGGGTTWNKGTKSYPTLNNAFTLLETYKMTGVKMNQSTFSYIPFRVGSEVELKTVEG